MIAFVTHADTVLASDLNRAASIPEKAQMIANHREQAVASAMADITCTHHTDKDRRECPVCLVRTLQAERSRLLAWKDEALKVHSSWDCQAVGKLLNVPLGAQIHANIEPAVRKLIDERNREQARADKLYSELVRHFTKISTLIERLPLNESAELGLQALNQGAATVLDATRCKQD